MNAVIIIYVHVYAQYMYVNTGVCRIPCHRGAINSLRGAECMIENCQKEADLTENPIWLFLP